MNNSTIKDILNVTISNVISLTSSILNGFIIPIMLGTLNYGYYRIFTLYASYTVLFHFGFNDGILLSYGGKHYNDLDKYKFRSNSDFFILFQFIIAALITAMAFLTSNKFYKILFILLGANDFTQNLLGYYQNISETIMNFTKYSVINIIQYVSLILSIVSILIYCKLYNLHNISFIPYVLAIILINILLVLWYLYDYREITFGSHPPLIQEFKNFKSYFISGFYMTVGYGISILILNLDNQFVVKFFSTRTYGIYAFAYSMFSAGLTILGSAAVVLLPHLKQHSNRYILKRYSTNISYMALLVYLAISGYFILRVVVYKYIFEYYKSMIYFRLFLPGMVVTCCVSTIIFNYYCALKRVKFYFYLSLVVLIISFLMYLFAYLIFKSPVALALSSTLSLLLWYIISDYFMVKKHHLKFIKNLLYILLMMVLFWICSGINNLIVGLISYLIIYMSISYLIFKKIIIDLFKSICKII